MGAFRHFCQRVSERLGSGVDARKLWIFIVRSIESGIDAPGLGFICRLDRKGRRLWRVSVDSCVFFFIYDHFTACPISVIEPRGTLRRKDTGRLINLEDYV